MLHTTDEFIKLQVENELRLWKFLDFVEHVLCGACWRQRRIVESDGVLNQQLYHHDGGFLKLLSQQSISKQDFLNWFHDEKHGFIHGFLVAFYYYQLLKDKTKLHSGLSCHSFEKLKSDNYECSKILYSCLFHDFIKSVSEAEPHDELLEKFFPNCLTETYNHSNPTSENLLVRSDRLDLARFDDYADWVDFTKLRIGDFGHREYFHFIKHIRPAISKIISGHDDVWICHNNEAIMTIKDFKHRKFYPETFQDYFGNQFAITHTDLFSVSSNDYDNWPRACSGAKYRPSVVSHGNGIVGCVPNNKLSEYGKVSVLNAIFVKDQHVSRDHFYFKIHKQIPIKEWVFLYSITDHFKEINLSDAILINQDLAKRLCVIVDKILCVIKIAKIK